MTMPAPVGEKTWAQIGSDSGMSAETVKDWKQRLRSCILDRVQASDIPCGSRKSAYLGEVADKDARRYSEPTDSQGKNGAPARQ